MASKMIIEAANAYYPRHALGTFGISGAAQLTVDMAAVLRRVRQLRDRYVSGVLQATRVSRSSRLGRCQCAAS